MKTKWILDEEALLLLRDEWQRLADAQESPALWHTFEWFYCWYRCFAGSLQLSVLVAEDAGSLRAISPLVKKERSFAGFRLRCLEGVTSDFPNIPVLCETNDHEALQAIAGCLKAQRGSWDQLRIRHVDMSSAGTSLFFKLLETHKLRHYSESSNDSPFIPVETDWESYFKSLSANFRRTLKNKHNRLAKSGRVRISCFRSGEALEEGLAAAFSVAAGSWQGQQGSDISSPSQVAFYREFARLCSMRGWLALYVLYLEQRPVAFEYNLVYRQKAYSLKWGYDPEFHGFSPGALLKKEANRDFFQNGVGEIDLLGASDFFKLRWTTRIRGYRDVYIYSGTPRLWLEYLFRGVLWPAGKKLAYLLRFKKNLPESSDTSGGADD